ncbi:hypothetical protein ACLUTX_18920 [Enterobacterales bacterium AE_CKDN230030158-1A_HGKHYDSX7]
MPRLHHLALLLPLTAQAVDLTYTEPPPATIAAPPAAPGEKASPRFRLTPDGSRVAPLDRNAPPGVGNPIIDADTQREYDNCQRLHQRLADQAKFPTFTCN